MTRPEISGISPSFIVRDTAASCSSYRDQLGFEITFQEPTDDTFTSRNVAFSESLKDTHDGFRGFEHKDSDGCVLFFGRLRA